ncbi:unnamed protein product, partial [Ceratitis capitata]
ELAMPIVIKHRRLRVCVHKAMHKVQRLAAHASCMRKMGVQSYTFHLEILTVSVGYNATAASPSMMPTKAIAKIASAMRAEISEIDYLLERDWR